MIFKSVKSAKTKLFQLFVLWFLMGAAYYIVEIIWRAPKGQWPHLSMLVVGGACGVAVGAINQRKKFFYLPVFIQSAIGAVITLIVELAAGCILNIWLGLGIWDYSGLPGNILGQICIPFALAWLLLMPLAIWLEDTLRCGFGWNGRLYSLGSVYKEFVSDIVSFFRKVLGYLKYT